MKELSEKESVHLLQSVVDQLGTSGVVIVYGDVNREDLDAFLEPFQERAKLCQKKFDYLFLLK